MNGINISKKVDAEITVNELNQDFCDYNCKYREYFKFCGFFMANLDSAYENERPEGTTTKRCKKCLEVFGKVKQ